MDELDGTTKRRRAATGTPVFEVRTPKSREDHESLSPFTEWSDFIDMLNSEEVEVLFQGLCRFRAQLRQPDPLQSLLFEIPRTSDTEERLRLPYMYLDKSPECNELFRIWDFQMKNDVKKIEALIVDVIAFCIQLTRTVSFLKNSGTFLIRKIMRASNYMQHLYQNLSSSRLPLTSATLRLFITMCTHSSHLTSEIVRMFPLDLKALQKLLFVRQNEKHGDVHSLYVKLVLSWLTAKDHIAKEAILNVKSMVASIAKTMSQDSADLIEVYIYVLHDRVLNDLGISRATKASLFSSYFLSSLLPLYGRQDELVFLPTLRQRDSLTPINTLSLLSAKKIDELIHLFLQSVCTIPGKGVCFHDNSLYIKKTPDGSAGVFNKSLSEFILKLPVIHHRLGQNMACRILESCPELLSVYFSNSSPPMNAVRNHLMGKFNMQWIDAAYFLIDILKLPIPKFEPLRLPKLQVLVTAICPYIIHKNHWAVLLHHQYLASFHQYHSLVLLQVYLHRVVRAMKMTGGDRLYMVEVRKTLPDLQVILSLHAASAKLNCLSQSDKRHLLEESRRSKSTSHDDDKILIANVIIDNDYLHTPVESGILNATMSSELLHIHILHTLMLYATLFPESIIESRLDPSKFVNQKLWKAATASLRQSLVEFIHHWKTTIPSCELAWVFRHDNSEQTSLFGEMLDFYLQNQEQEKLFSFLEICLKETLLYEDRFGLTCCEELALFCNSLLLVPKSVMHFFVMAVSHSASYPLKLLDHTYAIDCRPPFSALFYGCLYYFVHQDGVQFCPGLAFFFIHLGYELIHVSGERGKQYFGKMIATLSALSNTAAKSIFFGDWQWCLDTGRNQPLFKFSDRPAMLLGGDCISSFWENIKYRGQPKKKHCREISSLSTMISSSGFTAAHASVVVNFCLLNGYAIDMDVDWKMIDIWALLKVSPCGAGIYDAMVWHMGHLKKACLSVVCRNLVCIGDPLVYAIFLRLMKRADELSCRDHLLLILDATLCEQLQNYSLKESSLKLYLSSLAEYVEKCQTSSQTVEFLVSKCELNDNTSYNLPMLAICKHALSRTQRVNLIACMIEKRMLDDVSAECAILLIEGCAAKGTADLIEPSHILAVVATFIERRSACLSCFIVALLEVAFWEKTKVNHLDQWGELILAFAKDTLARDMLNFLPIIWHATWIALLIQFVPVNVGYICEENVDIVAQVISANAHVAESLISQLTQEQVRNLVDALLPRIALDHAAALPLGKLLAKLQEKPILTDTLILRRYLLDSAVDHIDHTNVNVSDRVSTLLEILPHLHIHDNDICAFVKTLVVRFADTRPLLPVYCFFVQEYARLLDVDEVVYVLSEYLSANIEYDPAVMNAMKILICFVECDTSDLLASYYNRYFTKLVKAHESFIVYMDILKALLIKSHQHGMDGHMMAIRKLMTGYYSGTLSSADVAVDTVLRVYERHCGLSLRLFAWFFKSSVAQDDGEEYDKTGDMLYDILMSKPLSSLFLFNRHFQSACTNTLLSDEDRVILPSILMHCMSKLEISQMWRSIEYYSTETTLQNSPHLAPVAVYAPQFIYLWLSQFLGLANTLRHMYQCTVIDDRGARHGRPRDGRDDVKLLDLIDLRYLIECHAIGFLVTGLSANDAEVRLLCSKLLTVYYELLLCVDFKERRQVLLLLSSFYHGMSSENGVPLRISSVISLFVSKALVTLLHAEHVMYVPINRFLLQRPKMDLDDIPLFYDSFHSSSEHHKAQRQYCLSLLSFSLKDSKMDFPLYRRRHVLDLFQSYFLSVPCGSLDPTHRLYLFHLIYAFIRFPLDGLFIDLCRNNGLMTFLLAASTHHLSLSLHRVALLQDVFLWVHWYRLIVDKLIDRLSYVITAPVWQWIVAALRLLLQMKKDISSGGAYTYLLICEEMLLLVQILVKPKHIAATKVDTGQPNPFLVSHLYQASLPICVSVPVHIYGMIGSLLLKCGEAVERLEAQESRDIRKEESHSVFQVFDATRSGTFIFNSINQLYKDIIAIF